MLHYLRIAVTALSVTACVLLIALWVRSYWRVDSLRIGSEERVVAIDSREGRFYLSASTTGGANLQPYLRNPKPTESQVVLLRNLHESENALGFGFYQDLRFINTSTLVLRYWLLVIVTAVGAAAPWIPWSRRFSLRTLLIATTLVAVALAAIVYASR
jgi:hypothetical protein